jgi:hypothetical protein
MAFKEAITWVEALDHATGCRVDAETVPMRAYVTGGASNDAQTSAMRARYSLTPRRACELDGSKHTSGAKAFAHAPPVGGDLGLGLG